ncbi:MAG: hypothetical protein ACP5G4_11080 [bacterium]
MTSIGEGLRPSPILRNDATDSEIDRMVYDLYGLNDDEIAIVEV